MNNFDEYKGEGIELFHGYEADFSVELRIASVGDSEKLYASKYEQDKYIVIKKDFYATEFSIDPKGDIKRSDKEPWIEGGINVTESEGGITEVTFKVIDPGIVTEDGGIEYPWLYPGICTRLKGIFRLRYMNGDLFGLPPREYRGFLKEMKPSYSKNAFPAAEYTFQCSGWEMTRTVRTCAYPNAGIIKQKIEITRAAEDEKTHPSKLKPNDRSWATVPVDDDEPYLSNKTILTKILQSYEYPVQIRDSVPETLYCHNHRADEIKEKQIGLVLPSIVSEPITDWLLMKSILDVTGSCLIFEPQLNTITNLVETVAVIENKSVSEKGIVNKNITFEFNRMGNSERVPFNPFINKRFVMLGEPSVTVSGNWQASPVANGPQMKDITKDVESTDANGNKIIKKEKVGELATMTEIDGEGNPVMYELDMNSLKDNPEADFAIKKLMSGTNFNFETVKKFFKQVNASSKYPEGGAGYPVYQFHGIEASFETIGNPLAQINTVYPILGLGKYYSIGVGSSKLSEDIASKKRAEEEKEIEERKKAGLPAKSTDPTLTGAGVTPDGKPVDKLKPGLAGLRLKSLTHTISNGSWRTSYNFGM